jgi:hypothetical protein
MDSRRPQPSYRYPVFSKTYRCDARCSCSGPVTVRRSPSKTLVSTTAATVLLEWECRSADSTTAFAWAATSGNLGGLPVAGRLRRPRGAIGASASACSGGWASPVCDQAHLRGTSLRTGPPATPGPISHKVPVLRQVAHPTTFSAQGVMPVGKRLARAGLVWMAFFKSA